MLGFGPWHTVEQTVYDNSDNDESELLYRSVSGTGLFSFSYCANFRYDETQIELRWVFRKVTPCKPICCGYVDQGS